MSDHRWQGYSHPELFDRIHDGPGAEASSASVQRWTELSHALGEIDLELAAALTSALAGWQGDAADSARGGLRPLGEWAQEARQAAHQMRGHAEHQAGFIAKARADMPPPVPVTAEEPGAATSMLVHLFGGQTDYEAQEARQDAAEQRAFDVMRTYQASSETNTTSLASFSTPPKVVVDGPPAAPAGSGSLGQQHVTITWGGSTGGPRTAGGSPQRGSDSATTRAGRTTASSGASEARGTLRGGRAAKRSTRHHDRERDGGDWTDHEDAEQVGPAVTEEVGEPDGFFDERRTLSRPVIGGEPY